MDNFIVGMFITAPLAEQLESSSPSVKTPMIVHHLAYLNIYTVFKLATRPAWYSVLI